MADYPSAVKTFATLVDGADSVLAAHQNDRGGEITAIETELGTDPAGAYTDVAARLDAVDTSLTAIADLEDAVYASIALQGLKMIWNSATSISVGVGRCFAENGDLIDVASALTAGSLSLSNDTWYHVYVYLNSGTPAVEVVTTAPTAWKGTAYSKTGDTSRRYVGSVRSGGSANVLYFVHHAQSSKIAYAENWTTILRVLSSGTATTETDVSCAALVPVTATLVQLVASNNSGAGGNLFIGASGSDNVSPPTNGLMVVGDGKTTTGDIPVDGSQNVSYAFNASAGSGAILTVLGYYFER